MHKRENELVTLIHGLELIINVCCSGWNVKLYKERDLTNDDGRAKCWYTTSSNSCLVGFHFIGAVLLSAQFLVR